MTDDVCRKGEDACYVRDNLWCLEDGANSLERHTCDIISVALWVRVSATFDWGV